MKIQLNSSCVLTEMVYISSSRIHKTILTYCITKSVEIQYFSVKTSWNFTVTNPNFPYEKSIHFFQAGYQG